MYIGICEDDSVLVEYLNMELCRHYEFKKQNIEVESFYSGEELLFKYPNDIPFDCLILDIRLKEIDGMEIARRIRKHNDSINIIFLTGDKGYVFDGYKVGAVRYLLKPVKISELIEAIEYVDKTVSGHQKEECLCINYEGEYVKIKYSNIISIQVGGHYITVNTPEKNYMYKETMANMMSKLNSSIFVKTGRSALVNVGNIERISRTQCVMSDGSIIPVTRGCYNSLNRIFIEYYK